MQGVRPLAPITIPQLGGAEPDFGSELERESFYEAIQLVKQLEEAEPDFGSELKRESFYEAIQIVKDYDKNHISNILK